MSHFEEELEIEVSASQTLTKTATVWTPNYHEVTDRDYDPTIGRYVYTAYHEPNDDIDVLFRQQYRLPTDIIRDCQKICKQLMKDGQPVYAGISILELSLDCDGWEEEQPRQNADRTETENVNKNNDLIEFL